jgi:hypothetical protein
LCVFSFNAYLTVSTLHIKNRRREWEKNVKKTHERVKKSLNVLMKNKLERERDKTKANNVKSGWRWNMIKERKREREMFIKCISRCTWHRKVQQGILLRVYWLDMLGKEKDKHTLKKRHTRWLKTQFKLINDFPLTLFCSLAHSSLHLILFFAWSSTFDSYVLCVWKGSKTGKNENKNFSLVCSQTWIVSE